MRSDTVTYRRVVEALRAGIPNRDVVEALPPAQNDLCDAFETLLQAVRSGWQTGNPARGVLAEGDFGTGKSHCLEYLRHWALRQNYVCSSVVLSKETPLHDLLKVFRACVESAIAPGAYHPPRPALQEATRAYRADRAPHFAQLDEWTTQGYEWTERFAATLHLFRHTVDEEIQERVLAEWAGYPMRIGQLRDGLRALGYPTRISARERVPVPCRFEFLSRFFRSAGYEGWILLFDEIEMIARYSARQRGRAYAYLAQLLGLDPEFCGPDLGCVFTITKDYAGTMLVPEGRNDTDRVVSSLSGSKDEDLLAAARVGMEAIMKGGTELRPATREEIEDTYSRVREPYTRAYDWDAPDLQHRIEFSVTTGMRQYIRSWINAWDFRRLYDHEATLVAEPVSISYEEDTDLQEEAGEGDAEGSTP